MELIERIERLERQNRRLKRVYIGVGALLCLALGVMGISFAADPTIRVKDGREPSRQVLMADLPGFTAGKYFIGTASDQMNLNTRAIQWTKSCPPAIRPGVSVETIPGGLDPERTQTLPAMVSMVFLCFG
jgi:hypothetical protein